MNIATKIRHTVSTMALLFVWGLTAASASRGISLYKVTVQFSQSGTNAPFQTVIVTAAPEIPFEVQIQDKSKNHYAVAGTLHHKSEEHFQLKAFAIHVKTALGNDLLLSSGNRDLALEKEVASDVAHGMTAVIHIDKATNMENIESPYDSDTYKVAVTFDEGWGSRDPAQEIAITARPGVPFDVEIQGNQGVLYDHSEVNGTLIKKTSESVEINGFKAAMNSTSSVNSFCTGPSDAEYTLARPEGWLGVPGGSGLSTLVTKN